MLVDILMASYNSEKYITAQLDSIINQDFTKWQLIIKDDFSSDNTCQIIEKYAKNRNNPIILHESTKNQGAFLTFQSLLGLSKADYVMFSDHDDVWFKNKISLTFEKMKEAEEKFGKNTPLLVFTDKTVTDSDLNIVADSSVKSERLNVKTLTLNRLLVQNAVSGCTMMINRALVEKCGEINKNAVMHDYWLALLAGVFGRIEYIDKPTMFYRQHTQNEIGAKTYNIKYIIEKLTKGKNRNIARNIKQAEAFLSQYNDSFCDKTKETIESFIKLKNASPIMYRYIIMKYGFFKNGLARNLGLLLRLKD